MAVALNVNGSSMCTGGIWQVRSEPGRENEQLQPAANPLGVGIDRQQQGARVPRAAFRQEPRNQRRSLHYGASSASFGSR